MITTSFPRTREPGHYCRPVRWEGIGALTLTKQRGEMGDAAGASSVSDTWLPGIEALRGIAACSVVLHHSWSLGTTPHFPGSWLIKGFGSWGVDIFFLLSGYLLAGYFWSKDRRASVRSFWVRRFFRIAPAYYVNLLVLFLFFAEHHAVFSETGAKQVAGNATFTFWLRPEYSSSFNVNGVLWTLSLEMTLYLLIPLLAFAVARRPWLAMGAMIGAGLGWKLVCARYPHLIDQLFFGAGRPPEGIARIYLSRQFLGVLPIFALGIGLRWLAHRGRLLIVQRPVQRYPVVTLILLLIPSALLLRTVETGLDYRHWRWFIGWDFTVALLAVPALLHAARPVTEGARSNVLRASNWLGERSYGIYLWHFPLVLSIYGRGPLLHPPDVSPIALKVPLILTLSILLGSASYRLVEQPGREMGRRLARRVAAR